MSIEEFMKLFPEFPADSPVTQDGSEFLCKTEEQADALANYIDVIFGEEISHTGYYDPADDMNSNEVDERTGYYYIDFD